MVVKPELCTRPDILHGGSVMAFADTLGAAATILNLPEGKSTTPIESKTNFVGPAPVLAQSLPTQALAPGGPAVTIDLRNYFAVPGTPANSTIAPYDTLFPTGGGTSVTITGTNFTGATAVAFGGTLAVSFTVNSATSITSSRRRMPRPASMSSDTVRPSRMPSRISAVMTASASG